MAEAPRDEGLDKLEAFIALLDAAHERIESGADRLESVGEDLAGGTDELAGEAQRLEDMIAEHGADALELATTVTAALGGLTAESSTGARSTGDAHDTLGGQLDATAAWGEASIERLGEFVVALATSGVRIQYGLLCGLLAEAIEAEQALTQEGLDHLANDQQVLLAKKADAIELARKVPVAYVSIVILVVIISEITELMLPVLEIEVLILALIAAGVVEEVERSTEHAGDALDAAEDALRAAGFDGPADHLHQLVHADWPTITLMIVEICALILLITAAAGFCRVVAVAVIALRIELFIAMRIVQAVADLLKALNPFD